MLEWSVNGSISLVKSRQPPVSDVPSDYDKDQNLSGHSLNSMKFLLIIYSKFVLPNLIWPDICLFWLENVW